MDAIFIVALILIFVSLYGLLTNSLYIAKMTEVFFKETLPNFFNQFYKKGVRKMKIPDKLIKFLKRHKVYYQVLVHPKTYTSSETAQRGHFSGKELAKVVMAKSDANDVMLVLPSDRTVDLFKLSDMLGTKNVRIEKEKEFKDLFPDCEKGAMPPFGPMYHLPCYVDESFRGHSHIYFNAGNHEECLQISTPDFLRVVNGFVGDFSVEGKKIHEQKVAV